ncbi:MAG: HAD hydrolase family protein, partial [Methanobacterium sp.]|nr:HAD hydrolase family protein [Methanobacterium sp.]
YNYLKTQLPVEKSQNPDLRVSEIALTRKISVNNIKETLKEFNIKIYDSKFAIHLTDPSINKGTSLIKVAADIGVKPQQILAIGDSENDLEFLSIAGTKIAVSNADKELKNIADYVTKQAHGNGVKEAIEKYIPQILE